MMISLIIQGPMLSKGITGKLDREIVEYDCRKNIDKIVSKYGYIFDHIVLSSWENDEIAKKYNNHKIKRILLKDEFHSKIYAGRDRLRINNKERQFYSTLKGCEYLEKIGYKGHVLKFRTDMLFDFEKIKDFFLKRDVLNSNKLFIPFISRKDKNNFPEPLIHFSDYYFLGKLKTVKKFCEIQLKENDKAETVHRDAFFKYAWKKFRNELNVEEKYYFSKRALITKQNEEIVRKIYDKFLVPMPRSCYDTLVWRGKGTKENGRTNTHIYYEDWVEKNYKEKYLNMIEYKKHPSVNFINYAFLLDLNKYWKYNKFIKTKTGKILTNIWEFIGKYYTFCVILLIKSFRS